MAFSIKMKAFVFMNYFIILSTISTRGGAFDYGKDESSTYIEADMFMMDKAKNSQAPAHALHQPRDCADVLSLGKKKNGVYQIYPQNRIMGGRSLDVYCDMHTDGGGWTVIQRRGNFNNPIDSFFEVWQKYKDGFGDLKGEFWLGNDNIYAITNQKEYSARFDLKDVEKTEMYATYVNFWIDDEYRQYMLHFNSYNGTAGDSMYPTHDGQMFSTKDRKNDNHPGPTGCAEIYKGAWWYNNCLDSNLNGLNHQGPNVNGTGIIWKTWKGNNESLGETEIKIRPKDFIKPKVE